MGRVLHFTGQEADPGVLLDVDNVTLQYKTESRLVTRHTRSISRFTGATVSYFWDRRAAASPAC